MTVRALTARDLPAVREVLDRDPQANTFVRYRAESSRLETRWLGGRMLGWFDAGRLEAVCHVGANIVPCEAGPEAVDAFAEVIGTSPVRPASIAGPEDAVTRLWSRLEPRWGAPRSLRVGQPFLVLDRASEVAPDLRVRRVVMDEIDVLYPACVRMFTEEVGVHPEVSHASMYRARIAQLITHGWAFAIVEDDRVLFKAELGAVTDRACQVQGVWVDPEFRGQGLSVPGMAGVVNLLRDQVAPAVNLYVNSYNDRALRVYARVGFRRHTTFATVLL
ncbi:MAG: GNAT family N-acetyltransferase [Aeromicrobium sp.]|uniref:GNAT family N-acetyltransferase n=1 Tax=Aeromicrobium sp. TaxID=1871063 RepID=UPI0039E2CF36